MWSIQTEANEVVSRGFQLCYSHPLTMKERGRSPAVLHYLAETAQVLVPGGRKLLMGLNTGLCSAVYRDFFDHHVTLSDRSLVEGLQLAKFTIIEVIDRFLPFTMQGSMATNQLMVSLYPQLPFAWRVFGQQFLIIAANN